MIYNKILNIKYNWLIALLLLISFGCERDVSDDAVIAEFPNTPDMFSQTHLLEWELIFTYPLKDQSKQPGQ